MSKEQIDGATLAVLNCYSNKYYAEGNNTEQGVVANAINDVLPILVELKEDGYRKQSEPFSCGHEKGEWKLGKSGCMYFCSACNYAAHPREVDEWNFCPRCGEKMKG